MAKVISVNIDDISYSSTDDNGILEFILAVKKGFPFAAFYSFASNTPFSLAEWSAFMGMSERTMQRHKREKKTFDPIYSEKILQIGMLYNLGREVFGDKEKFNAWLESKNLALGGIKPKELLDTSFGIDLLKDELTRIEHGVLA